MRKKGMVASLAFFFFLFAGVGVPADESSGWTGFYAGASYGGAIANPEMKTTTVFSPTGYFAQSSIPAIAASGDAKPSQGNMSYYANLGYNYDFGGVILGVQADFGSLNASVNSHAEAVYPCCAPTFFYVDQAVTTTWSGMVHPKLGVDVGGVMIYGTGGVAFTGLNFIGVFRDNFATAVEISTKQDIATGLVLGGGVVFKLNNNVSLDGQYLYIDYGTLTATCDNLVAFHPRVAFPQNVFTHTLDLLTHVFQVAVHYRL